MISLIILSGAFYYYVPLMASGYYFSQRVILIVSCSMLFSFLLYKKNKWFGAIGWLASIVLWKTFLEKHSPTLNIYDDLIFGACILATYYLARTFDLKENILRWFMIPALLNVGAIIIQFFDHYSFPLIPATEYKDTIGLLGNASVSACFIAMTTPIFMRYKRGLLSLLFLAIILAKSSIALLIFLMTYLFYLWHDKRKRFLFNAILVSLLLIVGGYYYKERLTVEVKQRLTMYVGTLDGIKHNPILGWGIGSFEPVISRVPPEESRYMGGQFNYKDTIMNHPHNELIYGWWLMGSIYPILFILLMINLIRKFTKEKLLSFSIIIGGFVCMMGYFLSPPDWFLLMMSTGIYENRGGMVWQGKKLQKKLQSQKRK